jgi:hypothetical protein
MLADKFGLRRCLLEEVQAFAMTRRVPNLQTLEEALEMIKRGHEPLNERVLK